MDGDYIPRSTQPIHTDTQPIHTHIVKVTRNGRARATGWGQAGERRQTDRARGGRSARGQLEMSAPCLDGPCLMGRAFLTEKVRKGGLLPERRREAWKMDCVVVIFDTQLLEYMLGHTV